jgi:hypothetical protein
MKLNDRILYHQIHPAKLATDWLTTPIALHFFWRHRLVAGLAATFVPPIVASAIIIRFADLERYQRSRFGRYIKRRMTPRMMAVRLAGALIMSVAAWLRQPTGLVIGLLVVLLGWSRGLLIDIWASRLGKPGRAR